MFRRKKKNALRRHGGCVLLHRSETRRRLRRKGVSSIEFVFLQLAPFRTSVFGQARVACILRNLCFHFPWRPLGFGYLVLCGRELGRRPGSLCRLSACVEMQRQLLGTDNHLIKFFPLPALSNGSEVSKIRSEKPNFPNAFSFCRAG